MTARFIEITAASQSSSLTTRIHIGVVRMMENDFLRHVAR